MDRHQTVELASHIFDQERELGRAKQELLENLVKNDMAEFFSINWTRLRRATGHGDRSNGHRTKE